MPHAVRPSRKVPASEPTYNHYTYSYYSMTKVVQLSDEAYGHLRNLKREGESFSDVVLRLAKGGRGLEALHGIVTSKEADAALRSIRAIDKLDKPR